MRSTQALQHLCQHCFPGRFGWPARQRLRKQLERLRQLPEDQQPEWIVKVRYLYEDDKYWTEIVNFGHKFVHIPDRFVRQYDRLLVDGVWCEIELRHEYDDQASGKRSPF